MRFLRTNTAVIISVGPFYDKTDGVTPETALTITNERITLIADTDAGSAPTIILDNIAGATSGTANDLNYITGQDNGMMQIELAAADVNRHGRMILTITDAANHVPVFHEFMVMPALVYDTYFASSGGATFPAATLASTTNITAGTITTTTNLTNLPTIPANWLTAAGTATDFGTEMATAIWTDTVAGDFTVAASIGKSVMNGIALGTGLTVNAVTTVNGLAANVITAAATATDFGTEIATAIWTDTTAGDFTVAASIGKSVMNGIALGTGLTVNAVTTVNGLAANVITAAATAADFGTEVAAAVWDMDATAHQTQGTFGQAIGDPVADTGTIFKATVTDATGVTVGTDTATLLTRLGTPSDLGGGATVAANLSDIEAQTDDIGAAGAGLTALATQASVNTIDDFLDTEIADIQARLPAALVGGRMDSNMGAISSDATAADNAESFFDGTGYAGTNNVIPRVTLTDTLTTYTGNTPQTGDVFPLASTEIADIKAKTDNLPSDPADQSLIIAATDAVLARLGVPAGASMSADIAAVKSDSAAILVDTGTTLDGKIDTIDGIVDAILADTGTDGVVIAAGSKTGYRLSATGVDDVLDEVIEGTTTMRQFLRGFAAALLAKVSGMDTNAPIFRDTGDTKDRITATTDADGNRASVTLDLS